MKNHLCLFIVLFFLLLSAYAYSQTEHPFLLVKKSQYPVLIQQQNTSPWSDIKSKALNVYNATSRINITSDAVQAAAYKLRNFCDAASLLYIIDTTNSALYKDKIVLYLKDWATMRKHTDYGTGWFGSVSVGMGFFASVLAYDVIYNACSSSEKDSINVLFDTVANDFYAGYKDMGGWENNRWGASGIWYIMQNNARKSTCISGYTDTYNSLVGPEGVFQGSVGYAHGRLICYSLAKSHFIDVLEFTGENKNWYNNPRVQSFFRWAFSHSLYPNGYNVMFGDTHLQADNLAPGVFRGHKFGADIAGLAAWQVKLNGYGYIGGLVNYVLMDQPLPAPISPESHIYNDGGAFFVEKAPNKNSLFGALWNIKAFEGHAHKDINAITIGAYGECIMRNSGYNGWGNGISTTPAFTWANIHDLARVNNVLLVNSADHMTKQGAGIVEGFTAPLFNYACGDDGLAISGVKQLRSFIMVHPQDGYNGYFAVFDDVTASSATSKINIMWHPNSSLAETQKYGLHYTWKVQPYKLSANNAGVALYLGNTPDSVKFLSGPFATASQNFVGQYAEVDYTVNPDYTRSIATVLYPFDDTHPNPSVVKIEQSGLSGVKIPVSSTANDYVVTSTLGMKISYGGASFDAKEVLFRTGTDASDFYFVKNGRKFGYDSNSGLSFSSDSLITMYMKDKTGYLISPGSKVIFSYPGLTGVALDGAAITTSSVGKDSLIAIIPAGTHNIECAAGLSSTDDGVTSNTKEKFAVLHQNYPNPFNPSTSIEYILPLDVDVKLSVFNVMGEEVASLVRGYQHQGYHVVNFDITKYGLPSGIYFYTLNAGNFALTKKMVITK